MFVAPDFLLYLHITLFIINIELAAVYVYVCTEAESWIEGGVSIEAGGSAQLIRGQV